MKIAVDARPFNGPTNGFTIYLTSILKILQHGDHTITLVSTDRLPASPLLDQFHQVVLPAEGKLGRYLWAQTTLRKHLAQSHYDVYFVGSNTGLPVLYFGKTRLLLGLLDLIPLRFASVYLMRRPDISLAKYLIPQIAAILKADKIITISHASAKDIRRICPWKKITVSHIKLDTSALPNQDVPKKHQFAYVGGVDARKKIDVAIRALALFNQTSSTPYTLHLIGKGYPVYDDLISELDLSEYVIDRGYLSEADKMKTIAESTAMVYLSLYEGYGLALTEAYLTNTPVICGPGGSQKEVGGEGALYVDPTDPESVATAMLNVLKPEVVAELKPKWQHQLSLLMSPAIDTEVRNFFEK